MQLRLEATTVYRLLLGSATISLILMVIVLGLRGVVAGGSLLLGSAVYVLSQLFFIHQAFARTGAGQAREVVRHFYRGEAVKFLGTAVLCAAILKWMRVDPLYFFGGYFVAWLSFILGTCFKNSAIKVHVI